MPKSRKMYPLPCDLRDRCKHLQHSYGLSLTPAEIDLLRECMKRTEDYYRGLLLLKQDWNAEKNEAAIAMIKIRLNMIDKLQEKTRYDGQSDYYKNLQ